MCIVYTVKHIGGLDLSTVVCVQLGSTVAAVVVVSAIYRYIRRALEGILYCGSAVCYRM